MLFWKKYFWKKILGISDEYKLGKYLYETWEKSFVTEMVVNALDIQFAIYADSLSICMLMYIFIYFMLSESCHRVP